MSDSNPVIIDHQAEEHMSYEEFCANFLSLAHVDLLGYKRNQMERRLRAFAARKGTAPLEAFWRLLVDDPQTLCQFLDYVPINVTEFFRDPERFTTLAESVFPSLARERDEPYIWCAGCANGAEVYSLAMLLHQRAPQGRRRILATDLSERSLASARCGLFSLEEIANIPEPLVRDYVIPTGSAYLIAPGLRRNITFRKLDLLCDPYPGEVDVILCRNVLIYFATERKQQIIRQLVDALSPGGYLLLGNAERIIEARALGLSPHSPHLYRKSRTR